MNEIKKQVTRAHRRILLGNFLTVACWSLFAGLLIATVAMAIPKVWHLGFLGTPEAAQAWNYGWVGGGLAAGLLVAIVWVLLGRQSHLSTAVEVDQRFKLKERLSSALSLTDRELESEAGQALVQDAQKRAETLDVREQFRWHPTWKALLPLAPVVLLLSLMFIPNASAMASPAPTANDVENQSQVAVEEARKKLKKKLEEMQAKGLKDSKLDIDALTKKIDNLSTEPTKEKRDALVKLNDIKKQLDERRKELGDSQSIKDQLQKMKEVSQGPAKKLTDALSEGEFDEAQKAIKDLVEKLKKGELNQIEQKKLAKDLQAMADQLKKMAEANEKKKAELQKKIDEAAQNGDMQKAAKLQQKLDQLKQQDKQMETMKKMAQNLKECAECMNPGQGKQGQGKQGEGKQGQGKQGEGKQGESPSEQGGQNAQAKMQDAAQSLEDLAEQLQKMQQEMDQLQDLEEMMEEIEAAKNQCQGQPGQPGQPKWQDWAQGKGPGGGKRDRQEEDTGTYKSRVKGKLQKGETVVTGNADGDNISGKTASQARELVEASLNKKSDPLENQKLPRSQREHVQQYFNKLRTGK
ncbi:MAG: hypothetical protein MK108_16610 [Mariniblastus sp.]|nr:hypothetical protein [Mariniblastus sp.]